MTAEYSAERFLERLQAASAPEMAQEVQHDFQQGAADPYSGVPMRQVFALAKEFIDMPLDEVEQLLESPIHKARVGAVSVMDWQARRKKTSAEQKKALFDLYLRRHDRVNILAVGIDDKILLEAYPKEFYHLCQS